MVNLPFLIMYIFSHAFIGLLLDIVEISLLWKKWSAIVAVPAGKKNGITHFGFYQLLLATLYVIMMIVYSNELAKCFASPFLPPQIQQYFLLSIDVLLPWLIMFFIQTLPYVGHYVIIIQRLACNFVLFCFISFVFEMAFWLTIVRSSRSILFTVFSKFQPLGIIKLIYLNYSLIVGNSPVDIETVTENPFYAILEMSVHIICEIILLNFVIAIFADTVAHLNQHSDIIVNAQRATIMTLMEERLRNLLRSIHRYLVNKIFTIKTNKVLIEVHHSL